MCGAFFLCIGSVPNDLKIGIVNEELYNYTDCEEYMLENKVGGEILDDEDKTCLYSGLGCLFIGKIGKIKDVTLIKVYYKDREEAFKDMKKGHFHYILHVPENYSDSMTIMKHSPVFFAERELDYTRIDVYRDVKGKS